MNLHNDGVYLFPKDINRWSTASYFFNNIQCTFSKKKEMTREIVNDIDKNLVVMMGDMNEVFGAPAFGVFEKSGLKNVWSKGD